MINLKYLETTTLKDRKQESLIAGYDWMLNIILSIRTNLAMHACGTQGNS